MRGWRWVVQAALAGIVIWFVARALAGQWDALRAAEWRVSLAPGWVVLSLGLALLTFGLQLESWRRVLLGWEQRAPRRGLAGVWFLANLGRYIPGKVWGLAGMVVLAARQGIAPWAATTSALVMQALGLGTALALVAVTLPEAATGLRTGLGLLIAVGTLVVVSWPPVIGAVRRIVPRMGEVRPLPLGALLTGGALSLVAWVSYGMSFWALSRGLGQPPVLTPGVAVGVFALGYTVGVLAIFAPGGVVVREAVLLALLAPMLGPSPALVLTLASRLALTLIELAAATPFLLTYLRSAPRAG